MPLNAGLVIPRGSASELIARVAQAESRGIATAWTTVGGPTADPGRPTPPPGPPPTASVSARR